MTTITLSRDIVAERTRGRAAIEALFVPRLSSVMTPASPIHALKAIEAGKLLATVPVISSSPLLKPEAATRKITEAALARMIRDKADAQNARIAAIETRRQAAQIEIDAAKSPVEIDAIIARYS